MGARDGRRRASPRPASRRVGRARHPRHVDQSRGARAASRRLGESHRSGRRHGDGRGPRPHVPLRARPALSRRAPRPPLRARPPARLIDGAWSAARRARQRGRGAPLRSAHRAFRRHRVAARHPCARAARRGRVGRPPPRRGSASARRPLGRYRSRPRRAPLSRGARQPAGADRSRAPSRRGGAGPRHRHARSGTGDAPPLHDLAVGRVRRVGGARHARLRRSAPLHRRRRRGLRPHPAGAGAMGGHPRRLGHRGRPRADRRAARPRAARPTDLAVPSGGRHRDPLSARA